MAKNKKSNKKRDVAVSMEFSKDTNLPQDNNVDSLNGEDEIAPFGY